MSFSALGLSAPLLQSLSEQQYDKVYPVQELAVPPALLGKDVLVLAPTGSGKTLSYVLPILQRLQGRPENSNRHVAVLVLVPTRELAVQVEEVFRGMAQHFRPRPKSMAVYGGVSINPQMIHMNRVEILVATPGRLLDLVDHKAVYLDEVSMLVLDEADKVLNLGFKAELDRIFELLPARRQNLLYSATLGEDVQTVMGKMLHDPVRIEVPAEEGVSPSAIEQVAYLVSAERKGPFLRHLIRQEKWDQVLVFASSVRTADNMTEKLKKNGIEAVAFHSQKSQGARMEALRLFKVGRVQVLVATDLAGRGIDIEALPVVINYELPRSPQDYVHRIGRTGRAGRDGKAVSLITPEDEHHFKVIQKKMGKRVPVIETGDINLQGA